MRIICTLTYSYSCIHIRIYIHGFGLSARRASARSSLGAFVLAKINIIARSHLAGPLYAREKRERERGEKDVGGGMGVCREAHAIRAPASAERKQMHREFALEGSSRRINEKKNRWIGTEEGKTKSSIVMLLHRRYRLCVARRELNEKKRTLAPIYRRIDGYPFKNDGRRTKSRKCPGEVRARTLQLSVSRNSSEGYVRRCRLSLCVCTCV